jgi:hypothetical protein
MDLQNQGQYGNRSYYYTVRTVFTCTHIYCRSVPTVAVIELWCGFIYEKNSEWNVHKYGK